MRKNLHGRILKRESKEQHLSTVSKSCSYIYIYIYMRYIQVTPGVTLKSYAFFKLLDPTVKKRL